jgi:hypothetical protein
MFQPLLRRLRLRHKRAAWASGGPAGGRLLTGEGQLGRCAAELSVFYRFYLYSGKLALAAMYLRRVQVIGRCFAASAPPLTQLQTVVTPPAPAVQNLGASLRRPCRGQTPGGVLRAMARIAPVKPATPPNAVKTPSQHALIELHPFAQSYFISPPLLPSLLSSRASYP